jgi:hypothetical protein
MKLRRLVFDTLPINSMAPVSFAANRAALLIIITTRTIQEIFKMMGRGGRKEEGMAQSCEGKVQVSRPPPQFCDNAPPSGQ